VPPRSASDLIFFTAAPSPFGPMLVATSGRGLCAVAFGDSTKELEDSLRKQYASSRLVCLPLGLAPLVRRVLALVTGDTSPRALALDVDATAFEQRVWDALRDIPAGQTRTYAEVAKAIGQPRAARAVGRICSQNLLALVIPCHRVVPASGEIGGYRWGAERKRALLEAEGRVTRAS
jgi:AraC family transcriptional regulator, regulatory protein of adaptative response / methylated-DNA-[protein]-cysteine methyltransferase